MATPIAWLMNLDADVELSDPSRYRSEPQREQRITSLIGRMGTLVHATDRVLDRAYGAEVHAMPALTFCPTPHALHRLHEFGLRPALPAPPLDVLRTANHRAFSARVGQTLPGAAYVHDMEALLKLVQASGPDQDLLLKRAFGFAGRERRRVLGGALDASTRGFAERSFRSGEGLQVEPWLRRTRDFALHGYLDQGGALLVGPLMQQHCDSAGRWLHSSLSPAAALTPTWRAQLEQELSRSAQALHAIGYFGPFGVDAFEYEATGGSLCFQPRCEINARFSMGYPRELVERALQELT